MKLNITNIVEDLFCNLVRVVGAWGQYARCKVKMCGDKIRPAALRPQLLYNCVLGPIISCEGEMT